MNVATDRHLEREFVLTAKHNGNITSAGAGGSQTSELLSDLYDLDVKNPLACGAYGWVHRAVKKDTDEERIIKTIPRSTITNIKGFERQLRFRRKVCHPNLVRILDSYQDFWHVRNDCFCSI